MVKQLFTLWDGVFLKEFSPSSLIRRITDLHCALAGQFHRKSVQVGIEAPPIDAATDRSARGEGGGKGAPSPLPLSPCAATQAICLFAVGHMMLANKVNFNL